MAARRIRAAAPPPHTGPVTAAALIRVSLDRTRHFGTQEELISPETQRDRCRHLCLARGWHLPDEYLVEEIDVSGRLVPVAERSGLQRVLELARSGQIQRLVVFMFSRLSRRLADTLFVVEELNRHGCHLVSVQEPVDTASEVGRMFLAILQAINQYQAELTARQVSETWATIARQGRRPPGKAPYGFRLERGLPVPVPEEYGHMVRVHELIAAGGTLADAVAYLHQSGARPRHGRWNRSTVAGWLTNPFYDGVVVLGGQHYPTAWDPPPLPAALREQVRAARPGGGRPARPPGSHPLAGWVRCGCCGRDFGKYSARDDSLSCSGVRTAGGCSNSHVDAAGLQAAVANVLGGLLGSEPVPAELDRVLAAQLQAAAAGQHRRHGELLRQVQRHRAALQRLCDDYYGAGVLTAEQFQATYQKLQARAAELQGDLAAAGDAAAARAEQIQTRARTLAARVADWGGLAPAEQQVVLRLLAAEVRIWPDKACLYLLGTRRVNLCARRIWQRLYFGVAVQRLDYQDAQGRWTDKQERFLARTWGRWPPVRLAARLGKSLRAVRTKAAAHGGAARPGRPPVRPDAAGSGAVAAGPPPRPPEGSGGRCGRNRH